jgi:hypothetical protein
VPRRLTYGRQALGGCYDRLARHNGRQTRNERAELRDRLDDQRIGGAWGHCSHLASSDLISPYPQFQPFGWSSIVQPPKSEAGAHALMSPSPRRPVLPTLNYRAHADRPNGGGIWRDL